MPNPPSLSAALFQPRSVALIGATADPAKNNSRAQRLLAKAGYPGRVLPINPARSEVMGVPAFSRVQDAPGPIDHAFIMVPAAAVPEAVAGCAAARVRAATIFSAGFAELGPDGAELQRQVMDLARPSGMRVLGPNCLGLFNVTGGVPLTVNASFEADVAAMRPGPISMISQSGSMLGAVMSRLGARGLGFSKLVSVGNECDLAVGELAEMLVEDADTGVLLLFIETFRDAGCLARAARRAHVLGKAVAVLKLGRSETGRRLAASHTGAMLGGDELAAAFFADHGIMRVDTLEALVELPRLVRDQRPPTGRRVGAVTGTGGAAALVLDRMGLLGDDVVGLPPAIRERLAATGLHLPDAPLVDLPMGGTRAQYVAVLDELLASDHCDAVLAVLGNTARLRPGQVDENILAASGRGTKPLAVFVAPEAPEAIGRLDAADIAGFRTPEACADALHAFLSWRAPLPHPELPAASVAPAGALLAAAAPGSILDEAESGAVFAALGIEVAPSQLVTSAAGLHPVDGPVAVKLLSPDIPHKTEAGLVMLGVPGAEAAASVTALLGRARTAFPAARVRGVLVAPMQRGLAEVIVGFKRDPEVGPVVMLGVGGVLAELRRSVAVRLAPVDEAAARQMVAELPELRLLDGYRNLPRGDVAALARAVSAVSRLAACPGVAEAEINPLIVRGEGQGAVAVDGLIATAPAAA